MDKRTSLFIEILLPTLVFILTSALCGQEQALRFTEPIDSIITDLKSYIPSQMQQANVPGLSIALIRDNKITWAEGFGVSNSITNNPVSPKTVFQVASNSKAVTTYSALRLVEQGKLSLDEPLINYLSQPWLPSSEFGDKITLRHLASHSSGLTDNILFRDKSVAFEPGTSFLYSGVGFIYMQKAIEQITSRSLAEAARELVFEPIGMVSSSFVNKADISENYANGHINYNIPLSLFILPFLFLFIIITVVGILVLRIIKGRWKPSKKNVIYFVVIAAILTLLFFLIVGGYALPNFVLLIALIMIVFSISLFVLIYLGRKIISYQKPRTRLIKIFNIAWIVICVILLLMVVKTITGPIPKSLSPKPTAVGSLRTTATDLAAFLIELANPKYLSEDIAKQIRKPQILINEDFSWGFGIGLQHSQQGDALWQNGMTFGFKSVMVIYPDFGFGVVVLTNSNEGLEVAYKVAHRTLGGKAQWSNF